MSAALPPDNSPHLHMPKRNRANEHATVLLLAIVAWLAWLVVGAYVIWHRVPGVADDVQHGFMSTSVLVWGAALFVIPLIAGRLTYLFGEYQIVLRDREDERKRTGRLQSSVSEWSKPTTKPKFRSH